MIILAITFNDNLLLYYESMAIKLARDFSLMQDRVHIHTNQLSHPPQPTTALEFSTSHDSCMQTPRCSVVLFGMCQKRVQESFQQWAVQFYHKAVLGAGAGSAFGAQLHLKTFLMKLLWNPWLTLPFLLYCNQSAPAKLLIFLFYNMKFIRKQKTQSTGWKSRR